MGWVSQAQIIFSPNNMDRVVYPKLKLLFLKSFCLSVYLT